MKTVVLLVALSCSAGHVLAQNPVPTPPIQIKLALLAAPEGKMDDATVYGYSDQKELILLRKGTGELICVSDDPSQPGFSVACYHRDLQNFMQRGRELRKQGKKTEEIFALREKEVKSGKLIMPKAPASLFVYSADQKDYNSTTGEIRNGYLRSVIYIPYATEETTGLPLKPQAPGMPWIMHPGTHGAHIMINPK
ncbi:MAG TPA: hypothetical protein VGE58_07510 [Daejeonella sp.]